MASLRPRMKITLNPDTKDSIERAAELMEIPAARLAAQFLNESKPQFDQIIKALELVKSGEASAGINALSIALNQAQELISTGVSSLDSLSADLDIKPASTAARSSSNSVCSEDVPDIGKEA